MRCESYYYNCSKEYLDTISPTLYEEITGAISKLPKRSTQLEINKDLFWILTAQGWSYDSIPMGLGDYPPKELGLGRLTIAKIKRQNNRELCLTSTTLGTRWHADFARMYDGRIVQLEAQFGVVASMFKDFCGFKIARYERRLTLGIEIVMYEPTRYFSHRKSSTSGMAYFDTAKKTLSAIGLECPIWLLGIRE